MGDRDRSRGCDTFAHVKPLPGMGVVSKRGHKGTPLSTENVSSEVVAKGGNRRGEATETSTTQSETKTLQRGAQINEPAPTGGEKDTSFGHGSNKTSKGGPPTCQVGSRGKQRHLNARRRRLRTAQRAQIATQKSFSAAHWDDKAGCYLDVSFSGKVEPQHPAKVTCSETKAFCPAKWIVCDIYKTSTYAEETFNTEDYNFEAQAHTENTFNVNSAYSEQTFSAEDYNFEAQAPTENTLTVNSNKRQSLMQDGGYQLPPSSRKSNLCESPLQVDNSQPPVLSLLNEQSSSSQPVPHPKNYSLKQTNPSKNSLRCKNLLPSNGASQSPRLSKSTKRSLQHPSQSKKYSPEKRSSHSSHPYRSKKHPPHRRTSHSRSPLPQDCSPIINTRQSRSSHSKSYSPKKRTSQSRSSRSNKNSPVKRSSCSSRSSKSKNNSPLRTRRSRSSRRKNRSPVKRTSRFNSSRSVSHSPLRRTNRLHSSQSRSRSPSRRASRLHSSRSKTRSPRRRISRIRSSQSKSCSPLKRRSRLQSSSSECHSPLNKTSSIRSYRSKSRSPFRSTSTLHSSHSRSRSPLRRLNRLRSSQSKSRSPSRRRNRLRLSQSRSGSPIKQTCYKSSFPEAHHSSQRSFAVRVDICTPLADDKTLKEVIFQRFVKFGFVTSVEVHHSFCGDRYALVFYDQQHELEEALIGAPKMRLYSKKIEVTPWIGRRVTDDCDTNMWDDDMTKFSPVSTRTLLIENLSKSIAPEKLDNICVQFDDILDIEIQQEPEKSTCSALVEFYSITSLIKAAKALNKDFFGTSQVKVTFAKFSPTSCLWLDGLPTNLTLDYLISRFSEYGPVAKTLYDCLKGMALVLYKHDKDAFAAMKELKYGLGKVSGNRVMVDFANDRTQLAFCQAMEASGQKVGDFHAQ